MPELPGVDNLIRLAVQAGHYANRILDADSFNAAPCKPHKKYYSR
jgi:hypothetical protein